MSHIMEKTLASLPKLLSQSLAGGKPQTQGPKPLGQDVMNFMKMVHRARSKTQESAMVRAELDSVKEKLKNLDLSGSSFMAVRNAFTKAIFCHLLGYDVSFLHITALKLCQQSNGYDKRLGYLTACLLLHRGDELTLLMTCTLQRDLVSRNMQDNWLALMAAGELASEDMITYLLCEIKNKLGHRHDLVRERAVYCLLAFHRISPGLIDPVLPDLTPLLSSRDPGVLSALMNCYVHLSADHPDRLLGLGNSFLHILHQIINRGFGSNFYYHMVPLPWLQISLLKVLGNLAAVDSGLCQSLCPVLEALIERTKVTEPISLAVLVESVMTATKIGADEKLLELCSQCIGKLLTSDAVNNMRYQGLGLLIALSKLRPGYAARHQVAVVECLNDSDHAIQARTTHLLHAMANTANVRAICEKMFEHLGRNSDTRHRQDILYMVSDLAERFISDVNVYLKVYFRIFLTASLSSTMRDGFVEMVLSRLEMFSQTCKSKEVSMTQLAEDMLNLLQDRQTTEPNILLAVQVLGSLAPSLQALPVMNSFLPTVERFFVPTNTGPNSNPQCLLFNPQDKKVEHDFCSGDVSKLRCTCLQVIIKLVLGACLKAESVKTWLENLDKGDLLKNIETRCYFDELFSLVNHPQDIAMRAEIMFRVSPSSLDLSLSFMDALVVQDMLQGGESYVPQYKLLAEQKAVVTQSLDESMASMTLSDDTQRSPQASLENSKSTKSLASVRNKWRDDEDNDDDDEEEEGKEQFTLVDADEKGHSPEKGVGFANELFAGLDNTNSSRSNRSMHASLWDDSDMSINIGFHLHPFGLPRKKSADTKWFDEDDNPRPESDKSVEDLSSLSEKCVSPLNHVSNSIYSGLVDSAGMLNTVSPGQSTTTTPVYNKVPNLLKAEVVGVAASIYDEGSGSFAFESPVTSTEGMSVSSTVDTLTDSDPADGSDE